jgi:hypothetical protein
MGDWASFTALPVAQPLIGVGAVASLVFTLRGIASHSWLMMWLAAAASFVVSALASFSIGPFVFLLTCLQLGAALALRRGASSSAWLASLLGGMLVWVVVFALPTLVVIRRYPWVATVLMLLAIAWLLAPLIPVRSVRPHRP